MRRRFPGRRWLIAVSLVPALADAQETDWRFDMARDARRVALAFPGLTATEGASTQLARELSGILLDDIVFASVFRIVDPQFYHLGGGVDPVDYYKWESVGADVLIEGEVGVRAGQFVTTIRIHAMDRREVVFGSDFVMGSGSASDLAHYIADSILDKLYGVEGVAQTKIAFASDRADGRKSLYIMDYDGGSVQRLTRNRHLDFQPRLSPDDETLTFISYPAKNETPVLAVLGGEPLFEGPGMIFSAEWSPDGEHIAFAASRDEPGNSEIYVMRRDGTGVKRLTHHPSIDVSPTWAPTGHQIAFTSDRTGSPQIYVMDAEGMNVRRVSMKGSYNAEPAWSPSRTRSELAYAARFRGGVFDIVVHDLERNEVRMLTSNQGLNESPRWAPNGRHLAFASNRTGSMQIWTMNRDGSNPRQLTFEGESSTPSWGPRPSR